MDAIKRLCLESAINYHTSDVSDEYKDCEAVVAALQKAAEESSFSGGDIPDGIEPWEPFEYYSAHQLLELIEANASARENDINEAFKIRDKQTQVVLVIEGGIVRQVISNRKVEAFGIDYDTDGTELKALTPIPQIGTDQHEDAVVCQFGVQVEPSVAKTLVKAVKKGLGC